jgi:tetratricopeptide (TPR) repeat protein
MGVVYRARREGAEHDVALKVIAAGEDASAEALARFQREARIATELDHPGIVKVLETGEADGQVWFAMELVEGEPLSQQIKEREFTWQQAVTIVRDVADALAVAHEKGVLHRDIKPSNILMDAEGRPHLTDFGLAKDTRTESKYTRTGQTLGTPAYMSPEQARGDLAELTPASDVWALGCVLYELLANRPAFEGDTPAAVIGAVMTQPVSLRELPVPCRPIIRDCLRIRPEARYGTAAELRDDAARALAGEQTASGARRRKRVVAAALGVIVMVAALVPATVAGVQWARGPAQSDSSANPAAQVAERAWAKRAENPREALEGLEEAFRADPTLSQTRVRLGVLRWLFADNAGARELWEGVPAGSAEWGIAQCYLGMESMFHVTGDAIRTGEAKARFEAAKASPGSAGRLARTALAMLSGRKGDVPPKGDGWDEALLRAVVISGRVRGAEGDRLALQAYDEALSSGMRFTWALFSRGSIKSRLKLHDDAIRDFDEVLAVDPSFASARRNRAATLLNAERDREALEEIDRYLALKPEDAEGYYLRGEAKANLGDLPAGRADMSRAIDLDSGHLHAWIQRGKIANELGDRRAAIADFDVALRIEPNMPDVLVDRGSIKELLGDPAGAVADYREALRVNPKHAGALINLSTIYAARGDMATAMRLNQRAVKADPASPLAWTNVGTGHRMAGDLDASLEALGRALEIDPDFVRALRGRAFTHQKRNDLPAALADLNRAIELEPANGEVWFERGNVYVKAGDYARAKQDFTAAIEAERPYAQGYVHRALAHQADGNLKLALADLGSALDADPKDVRARGLRGMLHLLEGRPGEARTDLERALAEAPLGWGLRPIMERHLARARRESGERR